MAEVQLMRMLPSRRLTTMVVTLVALVMSTGAAAWAETTNVKDKASDVVRLAGVDDERGTVLSYQDSVASGIDLRGMRVKHGKKYVSIRLKFARLSSDAIVSLSFRVNGKRKESHYLLAANQRSADLFDDMLEDGCRVPLRTRLGDRGVISMTFKRSCLGTPQKIKVAGGAYRGEIFAEDEDQPLFIDPISASKSRDTSWTTWLRSS